MYSHVSTNVGIVLYPHSFVKHEDSASLYKIECPAHDFSSAFRALHTSVNKLSSFCMNYLVYASCHSCYPLHAWCTDSEVTQGPLPDSYFVENLKACVARHEFDNPSSEQLVQQALCFYLGMLHGGVLSPTTGLLRPDLTTLIVMTHHEFARGYNVGRRWYFFDAMSDEGRHYTEGRVMQEMRDLVADIPEEFVEGADDKCIQYSIGTLLGAISTRLFPATDEEYR